jgi:hypothetical protein
MAIALARDWIVAADGQLVAQNLAALPNQVDIVVEGWTGCIDGAATEQALVAGLTQHVEAETAKALAQIKFDGTPLAAAIVGGLFAVFALLGFINSSPGWGFFFLLVALGLGGLGLHGHSQLGPRRDHVRLVGEQRKANGSAQVRGAVAEVVDWRSAWERELDQAESFRRYMQSLVHDAFVVAAPDRTREVMA